MKLAKPTQPAPTQEQTRAIQTWIGQHGPNIRNAYLVNATTLNELEAGPGIIERVLWRVSREVPDFKLDSPSMLEALAPRRLMKELRKQLKLDRKERKLHEKAFAQARRQIISNRVSEQSLDREQVIRDIEWWFKTTLPEMRDTKAIARATTLRLEAGKDIHPVLPPHQATEIQLTALAKAEPGRVYTDKDGALLVLLKPGETLAVSDNGLRIDAQPPGLSVELE